MPPVPSIPVVRGWLMGKLAVLKAHVEQHWPALILALTVTVVCGVFRMREAFGCDEWTYVSHAHLLRGEGVGIAGGLDPERFPALVPLCYELVGRNLVPGMPPGYSFELALAGLFQIEGMVSPIVAGLTTFLVYFAARSRAGRWPAVVGAALFAVAPITIWGGTAFMGDLHAACALLLAYVLLEEDSPFASGVVYGWSCGIRPTNSLFALAAFLQTKNWRALFRFGAGALLGGGFWFVFGLGRYVGPHMFGMYGDNTGSITYEHWQFQLAFIAKTTAIMFPLLVLLAAVAIWRNPRGELPLVAWALAIVGLYMGWRWNYDAWWRTRHVLPAYPALAVLGAHGIGEVWRWVSRRSVWLRGAACAAVVANFGWCGVDASDHHLLTTENRELWLRDCFELKKLLPRNSLVGALNFSGPLRMYAGIESFRWDNANAPELIDFGLKHRRPVYLLIEPDMFRKAPAAIALRKRYDLTDVKRLRALGGVVLRRVNSISE